MSVGINYPTSKYTTTKLEAAGTIITNIEPSKENFHHIIPFLSLGNLYPLELSLIYIHSKRTTNIGFGKGIRLSINFDLSLTSEDEILELEYPDGFIEKFHKRTKTEMVDDEETTIIYFVGEYSFSIITPQENEGEYRLSQKNGQEYTLIIGSNLPTEILFQGHLTHTITTNNGDFCIHDVLDARQTMEITKNPANGNYQSFNVNYQVNSGAPTTILLSGTTTHTNGFLTGVIVKHKGDDNILYGLQETIIESNTNPYKVTSTNEGTIATVAYTGNKVNEIVTKTNATSSYNLDKLTFLYYANKVVVRDAYDETISYYFYENSLKQFVVSSKGDYSRFDYNSYPQLIASTSGPNSFMNKLADNYLKNGAFNDNLANWTGYGSRTVIHSLTEPLLHGVNYLCELNYKAEISQSFPFEGAVNSTIALSFWAKNEGTNGLLKYKLILLNKGQPVKTITNDYVTTNNYFEQIVCEVTASSFFNEVRVTFTNDGPTTTKNILADIVIKSYPFKTIYEYDDDGNLIKEQTGPISQTLEYDEYNHLAKRFGLGFSGSNFVHGKEGQLLLSSSLNLGMISEDQYNEIGQLLTQEKRNSKQNLTETYTYNTDIIQQGPSSYKNARGISTNYLYTEKIQQISQISTPLTKYDFTYDNWLRLAEESLSKITGESLYTYSVEYITNHFSNRVSKISTSTIKYTYDFTPRYDLKQVNFSNVSSSAEIMLTEYGYQDQSVPSSFTNTSLAKKTYYNGYYEFDYTPSNLLSKTKYKGQNTAIIDLFTYEYNALEQLVKVNNLVQPLYDETLSYNNNNALAEISKRDGTQTYHYDAFGMQSSTKTTYNGKNSLTEFNQNYRLFDFNPDEIYLRFQQSTTKYANFVNLFDTSIIKDETTTVSETINPNLVQFQNVNNELVKNEITAVVKEYEIIHDGRFNAFQFQSNNDRYLEYSHNFITNPIFTADAFTISFWFKIDNMFADNYLVLMTDLSKNIIVQINADEQQNVYVDIKFPGKAIERGFITNNSRYRQGWNFVTFSWKRYEYGANSEYLLGVNGEYTYKTELNSTALAFLNNSRLIIGAGYNTDASAIITANTLITGIVIDRDYFINSQSIFDYFKVSRKLYLYSDYLNSNLLTVASEGINDYPNLSNIPSTYKVFPLHQSFFGLDGNQEVSYTPKNILTSELDTSFAFNKKLNRYLYVADGDPLFYHTGLSNSGFLGMFFTRDEDIEHQCLFEASSPSGLSFSVERKHQGRFRQFLLVVNGVSYTIGGDTPLGERAFLGVTWTKTISGSSITQNTYRFRINFKGIETIYDINLANTFANLTVALGRKTNEVIVPNGYGKSSHPLFGQIEFFTYNNLFMSNESILTLIQNLTGVTTSTQTDGLGLVRSHTLTNGNTPLTTKVYNYYLPGESNKISALISEEIKTTPSGNLITNFTYDALGNLTVIKENNVNTKVYAYDERGFLTYEAWPVAWAQNTYTYDDSGNILAISGTRNLSFTYETTAPTTLRRLLQAGSEYIDYLGTSLLPSAIYTKNSSGVPQNVANLSWQGRRLLSYINPTTTCHYTYDDQGFRLSKNVNGTETRFTYFNGLLTLEKYNNKTIRYRYDTNNLLYGFSYEDGNNTTDFFYDRDVLGAINGIYDSEGNLVVTYTYDAYGNLQGVNDTSAIGIGSINKVRYKGYYYDEETSFYYCHTRYYVPRWTRWLSGDDVNYLDPKSASGLNLFVYCTNNPVMYVDTTGQSWKSFWSNVGKWLGDNADIIVGVVATIGAVGISIATFGAGTVIAGVVLGSIIGGALGSLGAASSGGNALMGFASGAFIGAVGAINPLAAAVAGFGMSLISDRVNGVKANKKTYAKAIIAGITAGVFAKLAEGTSDYLLKEFRTVADKIAVSFVTSMFFGSHNFVTDTIINQIIGW